MEKITEKKMYIIATDCYQCNEKLNVAVISTDNGNGFCGPESFTQKEIKLAENNGVIIQMRNS
jgi:hypothetical protein